MLMVCLSMVLLKKLTNLSIEYIQLSESLLIFNRFQFSSSDEGGVLTYLACFLFCTNLFLSTFVFLLLTAYSSQISSNVSFASLMNKLPSSPWEIWVCLAAGLSNGFWIVVAVLFLAEDLADCCFGDLELIWFSCFSETYDVSSDLCASACCFSSASLFYSSALALVAAALEVFSSLLTRLSSLFLMLW